jgi:hypothetical protein
MPQVQGVVRLVQESPVRWLWFNGRSPSFDRCRVMAYTADGRVAPNNPQKRVCHGVFCRRVP